MAGANDAMCPECGGELEGARVCPECGLEIRTADDELTEDAISAVVDGALSDAGTVQPPPSHAVPYSFRLAVALAIAVPFAPLSAFMLASIVATHPIAIIVLGMLGWMGSAAVLARATVPTLVVGRGLLVLGLTVAAAPIVVAVGRAVAGDSAVPEPLISGSGTMIGSFLVFGVIIVALGTVVTRVATRKRDEWREADAVNDPAESR